MNGFLKFKNESEKSKSLSINEQRPRRVFVIEASNMCKW